MSQLMGHPTVEVIWERRRRNGGYRRLGQGRRQGDTHVHSDQETFRRYRRQGQGSETLISGDTKVVLSKYSDNTLALGIGQKFCKQQGFKK